MVDGLPDVAVDEYTEWQQSRVSNETFRENINKARDVTLENCLDLMQIYEDQDLGFFVKHGVKVGAARRFVRDIGLWVKRRTEVTGNENIHLVDISCAFIREKPTVTSEICFLPNNCLSVLGQGFSVDLSLGHTKLGPLYNELCMVLHLPP
ncbi:hypothetical protein N7491_004998 [Penicillium cf. griseofulvum]|uniref:Uncharacterized protein n=1 Tax=Penicillium cf. griseofulvum TaxID=2972120 RepID=A0A9W9M4J4_9EURO|nr:hypothetical protein N7472_007692 [Penicillium cf. griseofulvum]KAJ5434403.1 hypothetical protein N7491_004998 [Penicillium cf. griseofulvum]KAJ5452234.1 hypothetical protein N7445_000417 [Penicillium cf. griseofulvum]